MRLASTPRAIAGRWLAIAGYAIVGCVAAEPLSKLIRGSVTTLLGRTLLSQPSYLIWAIWTAEIVGVVMCVSWLRPRFSHFKNALRWPPALVAAVMGYLLYCGLFLVTSGRGGSGWELLAIPPVCLVGTVIVTCMLKLACATPSPVADKVQADDPISGRDVDVKFERWLKRHDAIKDVLEDEFGTAVQSRLIVSALGERRESEGSQMQRTIAVVGRFGVGKTSVIQMAESILRGSQPLRYIFSYSSCWGFEDSTRAQEAILQACVERLAEECDCNHLNPLPGHYRDAVKETGGWLKPMFIVATGSLLPDAQLRKFTPVLASLDAHLVIVIEDLDRVGPEFDSTKIVAMLHQLRRIERVSFIVAIGQPPPIDLAKVVDDVVYLEPLSPERALEFVDSMRTRLLVDPNYVDPELLREDPLRGTTHRNRPPRLAGRHATDVMQIWARGPIHEWTKDLGQLVSAARTLKSVLTDYRQRWLAVLGEVDPDELLIAVSLRHATPSIYQFVIDHVAELRELDDLRTSHSNDKDTLIKLIRERLTPRWNRAVANTPMLHDTAAILIAELLPGFLAVDKIRPWGGNRRAQSVAGSRGLEYVSRIHTGSVLGEALSDQSVLKEIANIRSDDESARNRSISAIVADPAAAKRLREFDDELHCLSQSQKLDILSSAVALARKRHCREASLGSGEIDPFRSWMERRDDITQLGQWCLNEVRLALPGCAFLAGGLIQSSIDEWQLTDLREPFQEVITKAWSGLSATQFAGEFEPRWPFVLQFVIRPILGREMKVPLDMKWLPEKLLEAMTSVPVPMHAVAARLFHSDDSNPERYFLSEAVNNFFGVRQREFYEILSSGSQIGPGGNAIMDQVRTAALTAVRKLDAQDR